MRAINKILLQRSFRRAVLLLLLLCTLLVAALALRNKLHQPKKNIPVPQEKFLAESSQYPSIFRNFVSTLPHLTTPQHHNDSDVLDDPRFGARNGPKVPKIYRPYPNYESPRWKSSHRGRYSRCEGPRGKPISLNLDDQVGGYVGDLDFPKPIFGSHEAIGLRGDIFFDRYTRYGAYGYGENDTFVKNWKKPARVKWGQVNWGKLQEQCFWRNAERFSTEELLGDLPQDSPQRKIEPEARTAVLLRSYVGKVYSDNDMHTIRSLISELSLQSGGEYTVILLLHVKDEEIELERDDIYQQVVQENVPKEFWDMTILWNAPTVSKRYPKLVEKKLTDVHRAQWHSVQYFALTHPQYEFFWNWELDSRFTGHHYELTEKLASFARSQPRRGLWERNARFYIPGVHGSYNHDFRNFVQRFENEAVWGPVPINLRQLQPIGPDPPVSSPDQDTEYEWGVGEDADYIGFLPIFHPIGTDWVIRNEVYGYLGSPTPRRASLITHSRLSRRLLLAMDGENMLGRHMSSELFPVSTALLHGFKAVTAPHPIYYDKALPAKSADRWFNPGVYGRSGSSKDSPFGWKREARFLDVSWYYRANLAGRLYWNFLGWKQGGTGGRFYEFLHGRHILPSILFHPIKDVHANANSMGYDFDFQH